MKLSLSMNQSPFRIKVFWFFQKFEESTRPFNPEKASMLKKRWEELPDFIKTENQMIGRNSTGCEGSQGVFPKCNLACYPCYHSENANKVPINGEHTLNELDKQLRFLQKERGAGNTFFQLIGGEVTLLGPQIHAQALLKIQSYNRIPMSFTHGDFDDFYLHELLKHGRGKIKHLSFGGHFDTTMIGRKGIKRVNYEKDLWPYRQAFQQKFEDIKKQYKVSYFLAHDMTVTSKNVEQIPEVIQQCRSLGFRLLAFQPEALIGNEKRWSVVRHSDHWGGSNDNGDYVWSMIEKGMGRSLPYKMMQTGDYRCNRTTWGVFFGKKYVPLFEENSSIDRRARNHFQEMGMLGFQLFHPDVPWKTLICALRGMLNKKQWFFSFLLWSSHFIYRAGFHILLHRPKAVTIVMHRFMDAADVKEAMKWNKKKQWSDDINIKATQERLQACMYSMAHPDTNELVPACVQHGVLDQAINERLIQKLANVQKITI